MSNHYISRGTKVKNSGKVKSLYFCYNMNLSNKEALPLTAVEEEEHLKFVKWRIYSNTFNIK